MEDATQQDMHLQQLQMYKASQTFAFQPKNFLDYNTLRNMSAKFQLRFPFRLAYA